MANSDDLARQRALREQREQAARDKAAADEAKREAAKKAAEDAEYERIARQIRKESMQRFSPPANKKK